MLLATLGAWAQAKVTDITTLTNDSECTFTTSGRGGWAVNAEGTQFGSTNDYGFGTKVDPLNDQHVFQLKNIEGKLYLYSVHAQKYVKIAASGNKGDLSETPTDPITYTAGGNGTFVFKFDNKHYINIGGSNQMTIDDWATADAGNQITIMDVTEYRKTEDFVDVTYTFTYKGQPTEYIQTIGGNVVGHEYPEITIGFPFGVSATKPSGTIAEADVVDGKVSKTIEVEVSLPFVPAADYASISNWYYISIKQMPVYYKDGQTAIELSAGDIPVDNKDAYTWAFVGNPFDGYELYNYVTGSTKILSSSTTMSGKTGNGVTPIMTDKPVPAGNNTHWFATNSPHYTNGFYLAQQGFDSNKMNSRDDIVEDKNILSYWTGGADNGSTFTVKERNFAITADLEELVAKASAINYGTTVGYYTQASVEELKAAIDEANAAIGGEPTQDEVNALEAKITYAMAALKIVLPEAGKFYNIVSAHTGDRAGKQIYVSDDAGLKFDTPTGKNIANVFQFVPVEGQEDQFYVYNVERGLYISTNKAHATGQQKAEFAITNLAKPITIANMGSENIVKLTPVGGAMIHAQQANSVVVAWDNNDYTSASAWKIVEVEDMTKQLHTLKVGELGYSTIYLAYDAVIPSSFEDENGVYVVEQVNAEGTAMNLKKIEGVLPANTGAIVKAPQGEYEFAYSETAGTETSMLNGSTTDKNIVATANKNYYILSHEEGEVAFFKTTTSVLEQLDGGYANIFFNNAFKAYLPIEQGSAARSLVFNFGGETGIHNIESGDLNGGNAEIYDLSGRRVQKAQKGLYIINGKKVVR